MIEFELDGRPVAVAAGSSLLDALREELGVVSVKDGCSPQGQCGCCTVWVDGRPRVACVTPVSRVSGRRVTTVDGLASASRWADSFAARGASQCGFCTPGIIMRLAALTVDELASADAVRRALLAHLCRCTGWQTIVDAAADMSGADDHDSVSPSAVSQRAIARAHVEGGVAQTLGPDVSLGRGGFADDHAPVAAAVAVRRPDGTWAVGDDLAAARAESGKVQGRRTTAPVRWPIDLPAGPWRSVLRTTWVEPAYLEPDAAWSEPAVGDRVAGGQAAGAGGGECGPLGNGGAFGGKLDSPVLAEARRLADERGRAVRVLYSREDVVRLGPKRPPMAIGVRADGTGLVRVVRTPGIVEAIRSVAPGFEVEEVDVVGPATSARIRAAGWAEVAAVLAADRAEADDAPECVVVSPTGAVAAARVDDDGVHVRVTCDVDPDDRSEMNVLRSYCIGAAHMGMSWVRSEALSVGDDGVPLDLTIRSFGVLRAVDTPPIHVVIAGTPTAGTPSVNAPSVNGSDAVFAAVAAATWRAAGRPERWPIGRGAVNGDDDR